MALLFSLALSGCLSKAPDTVTLSELRVRLASVPSGDTDKMLKTRLPGLAIARAHVGSSLVEGAGQGLFASRRIEEGELITLYPGDCLCIWDAADIEEEGSSQLTNCFFDAGDAPWATSWLQPDPKFVADAWCYGVRISRERAIIGDPARGDDAAYLGHFANDFSVVCASKLTCCRLVSASDSPSASCCRTRLARMASS